MHKEKVTTGRQSDPRLPGTFLAIESIWKRNFQPPSSLQENLNNQKRMGRNFWGGVKKTIKKEEKKEEEREIEGENEK
jgi:hypothetical protein